MKILYILIGAACLAGCSSPDTPKMEANQDRIEEVIERIDKTVADADRAGEMSEIVTQLDRQPLLTSLGKNVQRPP